MANLTELAKPFGEAPPKIGPPSPTLEPSYMDGSTAKLEGANPGRDQDRSRMDERCEASYTYPSGAFGSASPETDEAQGY